MTVNNEQRIVSKILTEPDTIRAVLDRGVTIDWFFNKDHRDAFEFAIKHYEKYGSVPSKTAVRSHFGKGYKIFAVGDDMEYLLDECATFNQWMQSRATVMDVSDLLKDNRTADAIVSMETGLSKVLTFADSTLDSYRPKDLGAALDEDPPKPTLMERIDGVCGLYRGKVHTFGGEYESLKTWLMQMTCAQVLKAGGRIAVIDFEDTARTFAHRLRLLGVDRSVIEDKGRVWYINPETRLVGPNDAQGGAPMEIIKREVQGRDLIVVDGTSDAMALHGWNPFAGNDDSSVQWGLLLKRIRNLETNAAVVTIDHVTKGVAGRGRHLIGSQHKGAGLDGPLYILGPVVEPAAPGKCGRVEVWVSKDRPGEVRTESGTPSSAGGDDFRMQKFGDFVLDSTGSSIEAYIEPWDHVSTSATTSKVTPLMEQVYETIKDHFSKTGEAPSKSEIKSLVTGGSDAVTAAVTRLYQIGSIRKVPGKAWNGEYYEPVESPLVSVTISMTEVRSEAPAMASEGPEDDGKKPKDAA